MTVEINNESGLEVDTAGLLRLADFALEKLRIHPQAELSIVCVDEDTMSAYHQKYMGEPGPTDVLSFPMDELRPPIEDEEPPEGLLGDIVLCPAVTARQAAEHGRTPEAEAEYLLVHGLLHLLGYDHGDAAGAGRHVRAEGRSAGRLGHRTCPAQCPGDASPVNQADWIQLSIALLLAMLAGLMAAAEAALSSLTRARAERLVEEGRPGALRVRRIAEDPPRYLNTALFIRTVCEISVIVLVALVVFGIFDATWERVLITAGPMIVISYVLWGVAPRTLGQQHHDKVACAVAGPLVMLTTVLGPAAAAADLDRQRADPRQGLRGGTVRDGSRAARAGRPGRAQ